VSLDDFPALEAARRNPEALLSSADRLTIDEVQRCPELLPAIMRVVDLDRRPGRFVLSGSANLALLRNVGESLAGRHPRGSNAMATARWQLPLTRCSVRHRSSQHLHCSEFNLTGWNRGHPGRG